VSYRNQTFTPTQNQPLPNGAIVDVSNGRGIRLGDGRGATAVFFGRKDGVPSRFVVTRVQGGVYELRLIGGSFKSCGARSLASVNQKKPKKPVRRLWGKGSGKFRTKGRFASATVRGTWWLTADFCPHTLVNVRQGSVTVRNFVLRQTVTVRQSETYLAKRPG
jgi:hypothetical protein